MQLRGFSSELAHLIEIVFTFPKQSVREDSPEPAPVVISREAIEGLMHPEDFTALDHSFLGNDQMHFALVQQYLRSELARRFHDPGFEPSGDERRPIYISRADAERRLRQLLLQPQIIKLEGTTGSGKSSLIGKQIHDNGHVFLYFSCAKWALELFRDTVAEHPKHSDEPVRADDLATIRANVATVLGRRLADKVSVKAPASRIDPAEFVNLVKSCGAHSNLVIMFDDVDALPLMVQAAVFQLAIDLFRALQVPIVLGQRISNATRLIREGAFADPVETIRLTPEELDPKENEYCLSHAELLRIYTQRTEALVQCVPVEKYFLRWHNSSFEYFFPRGLRMLNNASTIHIRYLIEKCDLFDSCNHSIRGATLVLANIVKQILLEENRDVRPDEIIHPASTDRLHLRLRDCLLQELFKPTTGTPSYPSVVEPLGRGDSISIELRALELVQFSNGIAFPSWVNLVGRCFPDISHGRIEEVLLELTSRPYFGDPLCVRTAGSIERSYVYIMPAGRYFAMRLSSSVDFLSRSYSMRKGDVANTVPSQRIRNAMSAIEELQAEWLLDDVLRLNDCKHEYKPIRSLLRNHYLLRALSGLQAYIPTIPGSYASNEEKDAWIQRVALLENDITYVVRPDIAG